MFRNYILIAFRNLSRNKVHSFINVAGLSMGMAVAMLIGIWMHDEFSFDKVHTNYSQIAKIRQNIRVNGVIQTEKTVPFPLPQELRQNYSPYFKYIVLSSNRAAHILASEDKKITKYGVYLSPEAPAMLSLDILQGSGNSLQDPSSVLIASSVANAFFGDTDPINKTILIDNKRAVKVAGVYKDLPDNTTFVNVKFIAPFELYLQDTKWVSNSKDSWEKNSIQAYVQVADGIDMDKASAMISNIKLKKISKEDARYKPELFLEPMSKWHLYSEYKNGKNAGGKIRYVWMFGIIGLFVLLLACINFMNLSTARSEKRAREVGIRKAIGSLRGQLIAQFFSESFLVVFISFIFSLFLVQVFLPFFNELSGKKMSILWKDPVFWMTSIAFTFFTAIVAGSYPAFYLSSFQPVKVLKGIFKSGRFAAIPRKVLVTLQFTVAIALIISTFVVFRQVQFARERPIGYDQNGLLTIPVYTENIRTHAAAIKDELLKSGAISAMAGSQAPMTDTWGTENNLEWKNKELEVTVDFPATGVSSDYGKTVGWQLKKGRDFSSEFATDSLSFILNESAVSFMGLKNPVGETIKWGNTPFTVIGVVKDIVTESPYEPARPSLFWRQEDRANFLVLKINPLISSASALNDIRTVFRQYDPATPFEYNFVDEDYDRKFGNEERVGKLAAVFSVLAILISCLGLFGMVSFMMEQRVKEIGIRKVLGASVFGLWRLLSKEFLILVLISLFIAVPVAWYFMHSWLQNYSYRSPISWWIFILSGLGAISIALITVSFQSVKSALANPAKSLKTQ